MTTDESQADRLAALAARRAAGAKGKRRKPAEASRILVAGAGTAAMLSIVAGLARSDLTAITNAAGAAVPAEPALIFGPTSDPNAGHDPAPVAPATTQTFPDPTSVPTSTPTVSITPIKTVTIAPLAPAPAPAPAGRTSGSR